MPTTWMQKHRPAEAAGLDKRDSRVARILDLVMREDDDGRVPLLYNPPIRPSEWWFVYGALR